MKSKLFLDISHLLFLSFLYTFCVSAKNNVHPNSRGNILRKKTNDTKEFHELSAKTSAPFLSNFQPGDDDKLTETESNSFSPHLREWTTGGVTCDCGYYSRNCTKDANGTVICECETGYSQVEESCEDANRVDIREYIVIGALAGTLLVVAIIAALLKIRSMKKKSQNYNFEDSIARGSSKYMVGMKDNPIHRRENPPIQPSTSQQGSTRDVETAVDSVTSSSETHQHEDYEVPRDRCLYIVRPCTSGKRKLDAYESKDQRNRLRSRSRSNLETVDDEEDYDLEKPGYSGGVNSAEYQSD